MNPAVVGSISRARVQESGTFFSIWLAPYFTNVGWHFRRLRCVLSAAEHPQGGAYP
jgi:hypothetical protein